MLLHALRAVLWTGAVRCATQCMQSLWTGTPQQGDAIASRERRVGQWKHQERRALCHGNTAGRCAGGREHVPTHDQHRALHRQERAPHVRTCRSVPACACMRECGSERVPLHVCALTCMRESACLHVRALTRMQERARACMYVRSRAHTASSSSRCSVRMSRQSFS
jgi:hypothetical protein